MCNTTACVRVGKNDLGKVRERREASQRNIQSPPRVTFTTESVETWRAAYVYVHIGAVNAVAAQTALMKPIRSPI